MKTKSLKFDIMLPIGGGNERFIATLIYKWNALFHIDINGLYAWIVDKRPSLKGKNFNIYTNDKIVPVIHFYKHERKIPSKQ